MILDIRLLLGSKLWGGFEVRWHGAVPLPLAQVLLLIYRISATNAERAATQGAPRGDRAGILLRGGQRAQLHAVRHLPSDRHPRGRGRCAAARAGPPRR